MPNVIPFVHYDTAVVIFDFQLRLWWDPRNVVAEDRDIMIATTMTTMTADDEKGHTVVVRKGRLITFIQKYSELHGYKFVSYTFDKYNLWYVVVSFCSITLMVSCRIVEVVVNIVADITLF